MALDADTDTFQALVGRGNVLLDFWGPRCAPCMALMPLVEGLEHRYGDQLQVVKVNAPENRSICRDLRVMGLPTYVLYRDGAEVERLIGDPTIGEIEEAVERLVGGR
jgi:thioredoxin 1